MRSARWRVIGGFTTFSSFILDMFTMGHGGNHLAASLNVLAQNAAGLRARVDRIYRCRKPSLVEE